MNTSLSPSWRLAQIGATRVPLGLVVAAVLLLPHDVAAAITPVDYGTASSFSILAGTGISNTGSGTTIGGDVGLSPTTGAAITGLLTTQVGGTIFAVNASGPAGPAGNNPGLLTTAKNDFGTAYTTAAGETPFTNLGQQLGGLTLTPGVYRLPDTALLTGTLTLDANSVVNPFWIFQGTSDLVTAVDSSVALIGATPCDVLWQIPTQATLGSSSDFVGTLMAGTSIVMGTGATLEGRAWAEAAITLQDNTITGLPCTSLGDVGGNGGGTGGGASVPDGGSTLLLLGGGLAALLGLGRRFLSPA